jgi:RimJ/RimL family protein N-acetyltransferase
MKNAMQVGTLVYLRPLERADLTDRYLGWLNDPEVNRFLDAGIFPYTFDELESFYQHVVGARDQVLCAVVDQASDQHIGNVKLGPIVWVHRRATFSILIGDKSFWGKGYGTEATRLMVQYGFARLNLHRIELGVLDNNPAAIRAYQKVGFAVDGRAHEYAFVNGRYVDCIWMSLLEQDFSQGE